jgi:hypothetical protein
VFNDLRGEMQVVRFVDIGVIVDSMPTGFFIWGYMYPFTFIFGGTS